MIKLLKTNPYRLVSQSIILIIIIFFLARIFFDRSIIADFEAYCPFGGMLAFSSFLVNNSLACSMTSSQIVMGVVLIIAIVLFSKLFCSFICPAGSVSEWIGITSDNFRLRFTITGYADILLRGIKYALLFITVYFTVTSSELFCKKFDPYYATVTGFGPDVSILWAIITISIVIIGSFFVRLFWCKYICPVGAVSNIFRFFFVFLGVTVIYLLFRVSGITLSFVWPLAALCIISYILEFYSLESKTFPLFKITRHKEICTNCRLCTSICPQSIDVESVDVVKHIDCHLCADCIHICPENGALTINRRGKKWLPALITIMFILAGIIAGKSFEIPTLSQYWGDETMKENMAEYTRSGLKNVKCFGSSVAFANQMMNVPGVTGVTTYVKTNTVFILFDPGITDTIIIQKSIFSPVRAEVRKPGSDVLSVNQFTISIDNFFDPFDAVFLQQILYRNKGIYGFTTEFDCPVKITIYVDSSSSVSAGTITDLIETRNIEKQQPNGKMSLVNVNYRVKKIEKAAETLSLSNYLLRINN